MSIDCSMKLLIVITRLGGLQLGKAQRYCALQDVFVAPPPSNDSPTVKCSQDVTIIDNMVNFVPERLRPPFIFPPVEMLTVKANGTKVIFTFTQRWANASLTTVAEYYSDASQGGTMVCDVRRNFVGEIGVYTAKCLNGTAHTIVYAKSPLFASSGYATGVPQQCSSILPYSDHTVMYAAFIRL